MSGQYQNDSRLQTRRLRTASALLALASMAGPLQAQLPTGGSVASGAATIARKGATLTVNQTSPSLSLGWKSFNIGARNTVQFIQPNSSSVALNQVLGSDPSSIFRSLQANGNVFLLNPNGILFAPGSQVNVGGLVASSLSLNTADPATGYYAFTNSGKAAGVANAGNIQARNVALLAPDILNTGTIEAPAGGIALAAGDAVTVKLLGSGLLSASIDKAALRASIQNHGRILATGGQVELLSDAISDSLINTDGVIQARGLVNAAGRIYLNGGSTGTVTVSGPLDTAGTGSGSKGGDVSILGKQVGLLAGAQVNASGDAGGGTVLLGGNWHGQGAELDASATYMDKSASINASATGSGDGGQVVLWSNDYTGFFGSITAKGGASGGLGGNVETSSHQNLQAFGSVDSSAPAGTAGTWLLDPANVVISTEESDPGISGNAGNPDVFQPGSGGWNTVLNNSDINAALNGGTSVTIKTTNSGEAGESFGDITVNAPISKTAGGNASLLLQADRSIVLNSSITSTSGALNVTLDAHYSNDTNPGSVLLNGNNGASIFTNGGDITIGGGADPLTTPAIGVTGETITRGRGVQLLSGASLNAGGGNISIRGEGVVNASSNDLSLGVDLASFTAATNTVQTSGTGSITIAGSAGSCSSCGLQSPTGFIGISLFTADAGARNIVTAQNGSISLQGSAGSGSSGILIGGSGVGKTALYTSGIGNVTVNAASGDFNANNGGGANIYVGWDGGAIVSGGPVTLSSANGLLNLTDSLLTPTVKTSSSAPNALTLSGATGIAGSANLFSSGGSITATNASGNIALGTVNAGNGNVTIENGLSTGPGNGITTVSGVLTGGTILVMNNFTGLVAGTSAINLLSAVNASGPVSITTASGDLSLSWPITENSSDPTTLQLRAGGSIQLNPGGDISSTNGPMDVIFDAHFNSDTNPGSVYIKGATVNSNGGAITIGGGADPATTPAIGVAGQAEVEGRGVALFNGAVLNAAGGNIVVNGEGALSDNTPLDDVHGIAMGFNTLGTFANTITTSGTGNIRLNGVGGSGSAGQPWGLVLFTNYDVDTNQIFAHDGNIDMEGTTGPASNVGISIGGNNTGTTKIYSSGTGAVSIHAASGDLVEPVDWASDTFLGWDGESTVSGGTVSLSSTNGKIDLTNNWFGTTIKGANATTALELEAATGISGGATLSATNGSVIVNAAAGDVVLSSVSTTSSASSAITIGAGTGAAGGTSSGGDVKLVADGTLTPGIGGRAVIYTGSIAGTAGFGALTPTGSGQFRYGRSYGDTSLLPSSGGVFVQYREQPTLTLTPVSGTTYNGTTLNNADFSDSFANYAVSGWQNGDSTATPGAGLSGSLAFNGSTSTAVRNAGTYGVTLGTLSEGFGYALSIPLNSSYVINPAAITVTAATNTKTYDGTTSAAAVPTITAGSLQGDDSITMAEAYTGKNAGMGLIVTPSAVINDGNNGANYSVTLANNANSVINPAAITVTAATNTKTYDGTTSAAAVPTITAGSLKGDDSITMTEAYTGRNARTGLTVTPSAVISDGNNGGNYSVTLANNVNSVINPAAITVTAATNTKTYDGTTSAAAVPTITAGSLQGDDSITMTEAYTGRNAGTGLIVAPSAVVSDGNNGNNYSVALANNANSVINPAAITVTAATNTKTYDGTTSAVAVPTITTGSLQGDDSITMTEAYTSRNAGTGLTVAPSAVVNDGNNGANYSVTLTNNLDSVITASPATVVAEANTQTYDRTTVTGSTASTVFSAPTQVSATNPESGPLTASAAGDMMLPLNLPADGLTRANQNRQRPVKPQTRNQRVKMHKKHNTSVMENSR